MNEPKHITELPSKHAEVHIWTKPETQQVLKGLRQYQYEVTKEIEQDHYIKYTVTALIKPVGRDEIIKAELLTATTTKYDNSYLVRHHKQLFNS